jgi:hypothetical protein
MSRSGSRRSCHAVDHLGQLSRAMQSGFCPVLVPLTTSSVMHRFSSDSSLLRHGGVGAGRGGRTTQSCRRGVPVAPPLREGSSGGSYGTAAEGHVLCPAVFPVGVPLAIPSADPSCRPGTASRRWSGPASRDGTDGQRTGRGPRRAPDFAREFFNEAIAERLDADAAAAARDLAGASAICSQLARRAGPRGCRSAGCRRPSGRPPRPR